MYSDVVTIGGYIECNKKGQPMRLSYGTRFSIDLTQIGHILTQK